MMSPIKMGASATVPGPVYVDSSSWAPVKSFFRLTLILHCSCTVGDMWTMVPGRDLIWSPWFRRMLRIELVLRCLTV
jgi:hypothetical protein